MSAARFAVAALLVARVAAAQEMSEDEIERRVHFIETRLKAEATQARWYEASWAIVYTAGVGYGGYQISQSHSNAELTEGIVGISKSVIGAAGLALGPLKAARAPRELDEGASSAPGQRDVRLALAESLLERNARESDIRYKWQPHVVNLVLNLAGGAAIWIAGDWKRALQSTAIAIPVGELSIWSRPWGAKRDLREYRREFGSVAFSDATRKSILASRPTVNVAASAVAFTF